MKPHDYGEYYWCVKVLPELSQDREIYVHADTAQVIGGDLVFARQLDSGEYQPILAIARSQWTAFFAASHLDGSAVGVERWAGEVDRGR